MTKPSAFDEDTQADVAQHTVTRIAGDGTRHESLLAPKL